MPGEVLVVELFKELLCQEEELGIGRPSTYASIISVISTRGYVETLNKRFHPTDRGKLITAFLEKLFSKYVDYNFTAGLENQLDEITSGKEGWIKVLEMFWKDFNQNVTEVKEKRTREVLDLLNESLGDLIFNKNIFLTLWLSIFFSKAIFFSQHSKLNNLLPWVKLCFQ